MVQMIKRIRERELPVINAPEKYLTLVLGKEEYAINILMIQEIMCSSRSGKLNIKKIADVPPHIQGVLDLHNTIIPIIDLRIFYHIKPTKHEKYKLIIVVNIHHNLIGIVSDSLPDIIELTRSQIKPIPDFLSVVHHGYIRGIASLGERTFAILDIESLLMSEELDIKFK